MAAHFESVLNIGRLVNCERVIFDQAAKLKPPCGVAQGDLLIPVTGSGVCAVEGGVEKRNEMGQAHQGVVAEACFE